MNLQIINPIAHNGTEYGRGLYETGTDISEELAAYFLQSFPWAATIYKPDVVHKAGIARPTSEVAIAAPMAALPVPPVRPLPIPGKPAKGFKP